MTTPKVPKATARGASKPIVARGMGPAPVRLVFAGLACLYFVLLIKHPDPKGWVAPIAYFTECTGLFTRADGAASEYRVDAWSCARHDWEPMDPRPYFPMRADDKEARFQRLAYFYKRERKVLNALDDYFVAHHAEMDDGVDGPIGGIRLVQLERAIPEPGSEVDRYAYEPRSPVPADVKRFDLYYTTSKRRHAACGRAASSSAPEPAEPAEKPEPEVGSSAPDDPWANP